MLKTLGRYKAYLQRSAGYISLLNLTMIATMFLKDLGIDLKWYWYPLIIMGTIAIFLVWGYIDTRSRIREMESLDNELRRPILMDIYKKINAMYDNLNQQP